MGANIIHKGDEAYDYRDADDDRHNAFEQSQSPTKTLRAAA